MSTERSPHATRPADPGPDETAKPRIDLSLTQVLGGALAAMTAAFLGSRLSVAGTVVGAALASVVAAVGSTLYTASLRASRERVRTVFRGRVDGSDVPATVESVADRDLQTTVLASVSPGASATVRPTPTASGRVRLRWRSVLVGALGVFALAAAALTAVELVTGQALSGEKGTTISQVTEPQGAGPADDSTPSATPSASPSGSASTRPTPSLGSSAAPSPSASDVTPPSAAPSATTGSPSSSATAVSPTPSAGR